MKLRAFSSRCLIGKPVFFLFSPSARSMVSPVQRHIEIRLPVTCPLISRRTRKVNTFIRSNTNGFFNGTTSDCRHLLTSWEGLIVTGMPLTIRITRSQTSATCWLRKPALSRNRRVSFVSGTMPMPISLVTITI